MEIFIALGSIEFFYILTLNSFGVYYFLFFFHPINLYIILYRKVDMGWFDFGLQLMEDIKQVV